MSIANFIRNFSCILACIVFSTGGAVGQENNYEPRKGHWRFQLTLQPESGSNETATFSSASYPATCSRNVGEYAARIEASNGYVWYNPEIGLLAFKESEYAKDRYEVISLACNFVPWTD